MTWKAEDRPLLSCSCSRELFKGKGEVIASLFVLAFAFHFNLHFVSRKRETRISGLG